jgi:hypothetical protein
MAPFSHRKAGSKDECTVGPEHLNCFIYAALNLEFATMMCCLFSSIFHSKDSILLGKRYIYHIYGYQRTNQAVVVRAW